MGKVGIILLTKLLSFANKEFLAGRVRSRCTVNINLVRNGMVKSPPIDYCRISGRVVRAVETHLLRQ